MTDLIYYLIYWPLHRSGKGTEQSLCMRMLFVLRNLEFSVFIIARKSLAGLSFPSLTKINQFKY